MEVVTSQRMDEAEWNSSVQNMVAQASDAEVKVIVEYFGEDAEAVSGH